MSESTDASGRAPLFTLQQLPGLEPCPVGAKTVGSELKQEKIGNVASKTQKVLFYSSFPFSILCPFLPPFLSLFVRSTIYYFTLAIPFCCLDMLYKLITCLFADSSVWSQFFRREQVAMTAHPLLLFGFKGVPGVWFYCEWIYWLWLSNSIFLIVQWLNPIPEGVWVSPAESFTYTHWCCIPLWLPPLLQYLFEATNAASGERVWPCLGKLWNGKVTPNLHDFSTNLKTRNWQSSYTGKRLQGPVHFTQIPTVAVNCVSPYIWRYDSSFEKFQDFSWQ